MQPPMASIRRGEFAAPTEFESGFVQLLWEARIRADGRAPIPTRAIAADPSSGSRNPIA
jgi:hypothetical protein